MIQATLVLIVAYCAVKLFPRQSPAERHVVWVAGLMTAALMPLVSSALAAWRPDWIRTVADLLPPLVRQTSQAVSADGTAIVVRASALERVEITFVRALSAAWTVGAIVALLRLAVRAATLRHLALLARPVVDPAWQGLADGLSRRLRIRRGVSLLESALVPVPITWGFRRPRIVLPLHAAAWSADRRRAVLLHELAHIRRCDWVTQLLGALVCAVYWFHPLFWLALQRLRQESERACDDVVVNSGVDAVDYARHLLSIVRTARTGDRRWRNALAVVQPSQLEQRFAALLAAAANRRPASSRRVGAVCTITAAFVVPLAAAGSPFVDATIRVHTGSLPATIETLTVADTAAPSAVRSTRAVDIPASQSVIPPEVLEYTTPPLYSDEARRRRIEGIVSIEARIDLEGRVNQPRVVRALGSGLDENALVALRQWRFRPGTQAGRAVEMTAEVDIEFNLRNEALNELIANDMATRIGSGVTPPRIVRAVSVPPREGREERVVGTVALDVVLLEDGTPKIVRVLQSLTPSLDERAIEVFEQWRFSPALRGGRAVKVRLQADVTFR